MRVFATLQDVINLSGQPYTADQQARISVLLPLISDSLRYEAKKVGKDMDAMVAGSISYASVCKLVMVDIVIRVMRQEFSGDPMSQESQSALGYTWSGTYAVAGGGIAAAILRNDLKRLGLRRQRYGWDDLYETTRNTDTADPERTDWNGCV